MPSEYDIRQANRYERIGTSVGNLLHDRFQAKQAEDFMTNEYQAFKDSTSNFMNGLASIEDGDQMAQEFTAWKQDTFMPFMTNASAKYANNERIMNIVQMTAQANQNGLQEWISVEEAGEQFAGREERRGRETEAAELGLEQTRATIEARRAEAGLATARAEEIGGGELPFVAPGTSLDKVKANVRDFMTNKRYTQQRQEVLESIDQQALSAITIEMQQSGARHPDGTAWNSRAPGTDEKNRVAAWNLWQASDDKRLIIEGVVAHNLGARLGDYGGLYDPAAQFVAGVGIPLSPAERTPPLRSNAPASSVLGRVLATDETVLAQRGWSTSSIKEFIDDDLDDLPSGRQGYAQLGDQVMSILDSVTLDPHAGFIGTRSDTLRGTVQEPLRHYNDLVKYYQKFWEAEVIQKMIHPSAKSQQDQVRRLGQAIIQKYAIDKAHELNMIVPEKAEAKQEKSYADKAISLIRDVFVPVGLLR